MADTNTRSPGRISSGPLNAIGSVSNCTHESTLVIRPLTAALHYGYLVGLVAGANSEP